MKVIGNLCFPAAGHKRRVTRSLDEVWGVGFPLASESTNPAAESSALYLFEICLPDEGHLKIERNVLYFFEGCDHFLNISITIIVIFNKGRLLYL